MSLKEWIEYHRIIGVDHFYLYNNFSSDNYLEILQPYIKKGIVTLTEWPVAPPSQVPAYNHFKDNFWSETNWVAFIDLDEYICPKYADTIQEWIAPFKNYPSLVVYWKQFGSSGQLVHDHSRLITEQYTIAWSKYYDYGKPFFNTEFDVHSFSRLHIHELPARINCFGYSLKLPPINEFRKFVHFRTNRTGWFTTSNDFTIQINHYVTKSYEEFFVNKRKRGTAVSTGKVAAHIRSSYAYNFAQSFATEADYTIQRFMVRLKLRMRGIEEYDIESFVNKIGNT